MVLRQTEHAAYLVANSETKTRTMEHPKGGKKPGHVKPSNYGKKLTRGSF